MTSSPIQTPKYLKLFVGLVLVNYFLSICFILIAASNNNELGKEEDNGLGWNVFKERVKRGEETGWPISPEIIIVILVVLLALCFVLFCYYCSNYNLQKTVNSLQKAELDSTNRLLRERNAMILTMIKEEMAEREKKKRKAKEEEDEVYKVKEDKDKDDKSKEDKNKEGKDNSRMAFI
uniref:Uncharacterized protein n=1 Tax=Meloidogyne enterolobii TaxID=390850 RepID=A0A6V7YAM4_MELEN|nr:unnamed protein product [Meloidogyne enterolobii]